MKKFYLLITILCILFAKTGFSQNSSKNWSILQTYQVPEGISGLAWDGQFIYFGIYGANGNEIYKFDPTDGSYQLFFNGPQDDAFGLTYDGQYLWTTDHPGSSSDPAIAIQMDTLGNNIGQFNLPDHYMSGIAYDGGDFWVSTYYSPDGHIYKVDNAGNIIKDFAAPDDQPWDLAIGDSCLWMADKWGHNIYQIDTSDGSLIETYPSEVSDPTGIVYDGNFLWYCDEGAGGNDYLYKVDPSGSGTPVIYLPETSHHYGPVNINNTGTWNMTVQNNGNTDLVINSIDIPANVPVSVATTLPITVATSSSETINIEYTPTEYSGLETTLTIHSTDPVNPAVDVEVTGYGIYVGAALVIADNTHDYGTVRQGAYTRQFYQLENAGDENIVIDDIVSTNDDFIIDPSVEFPLQVNILDTFSLPVWYSPSEPGPESGQIHITSNSVLQNTDTLFLQGTSDDSDQPIGTQLWNYTISGSYDNSPKAVLSIPDMNGDNINDVVIGSEDGKFRCFNGNSHGIADLMWVNDNNGSLYHQKALQSIKDIDDDGYDDIIVGTAWGDRSVIAISGKTGENIWKFDTHIYGQGGWIYQVNVKYDYNGDGMKDVLASSGDDSDGTGPKRVHCLNGINGDVIWEYQSEGPVFSVIGVEDFNGDGQPDVLAGTTNANETKGKAVALDGANGSLQWSFSVNGTSIWALEQISDINNDGVNDVAVGDFGMTNGGYVFYIDSRTGSEISSGHISNASLALRFETLDDVNGDGKKDLLPGHSGSEAVVMNGVSAQNVWQYPVATDDKAWNARRIQDISGDGINDVIIGSLYTVNECYFLNGKDGSELSTVSYSQPIDGLGVIEDIVGDGSMEVVVGGREGLLKCLSGGLYSAYPSIDAPTEHNFNITQVGNTEEWEMQISNYGDAPLQVDTVTTKGNHEVFYSSSDFPVTIANGSSEDVSIVFAPLEVTSYEDTITIYSNDPDYPEIEVALTGEGAANIFSINKNDAINVYPNPAKDQVEILVNKPFNQSVELNVYNTEGKTVYAGKWNPTNTSNSFELNFEEHNLIPGNYFIKIYHGEDEYTRKLVIIE